jgi:hypothetical protein
MPMPMPPTPAAARCNNHDLRLLDHIIHLDPGFPTDAQRRRMDDLRCNSPTDRRDARGCNSGTG